MMSDEDLVVEAPSAVETTDLHFKSLSKLRLFDGTKLSFDTSLSLLAVSQYYGLVFVGTSNGFLILKSKEVFSVDNSNEFHQKEVLLNSRTLHLAISFEQKHLAVCSQTNMGPVVYIYDIGSFLTKEISPMKTVPLSEPFQNPVVRICEVMWQPNNLSGLTLCFTDGSVSTLSLFQGNGNGVFSLPNTTQARCICWSPKGKQIVIGCSDGTLSQCKPDLKFIKKLPVPCIFEGPVSVVNVLWISSFQFIGAYKDHQKTEEFPLFVLINAQKNEPIKYVNYDDITFSTTFFRNHQLYFHHLSAWNIMLLASANSIEVAVLHGKQDNSVWEQWLLGDDSRAELPLNADKVETFPIGIALDYTSDQSIPWGEESLPPAPRLLLLSSEGLLVTFSILNMCKGHPVLTHPPKEIFDDSWFTLKGKNDPSSVITMNQPSADFSISPAKPLESANPMEKLEVNLDFSSCSNMPLMQQHNYTSLGYNNFYGPHSKEHGIFPSQQTMLNQQPQLACQQPYQTNNILVTPNQKFSLKWPQNPSVSFPLSMGTSGESGQGIISKGSEHVTNFEQNSNVFNASALAPKESTFCNDAKESVGLMKEPTQMMKFNESANVVQTSSSLTVEEKKAPPPITANVNAEQTLSNKNSKASPSRSAADIMAVSSKLYVTALMDEIDHFDAELKEVLARVSAVRVHIGTDEEKMNLRRSIEKLNDFEKNLSDTTSGQKNEIHSVKSDVIEAFAWLEDARSRNRQRKSRTYIELKKSENLDPMSSRIMSEISHLKYYIENQLKQLHAYLMREWMEHENNCRVDIKIISPCDSVNFVRHDLEELLKSQIKELFKSQVALITGTDEKELLQLLKQTKKSLMIVPSMEELYKTMHLELKILHKLRATVEELRLRMTERNMKIRSQTALITDSVSSHSKSVDDSSRMSELYKLADNLLQIKIDRDEADDYINVTDAFQLMIKNQINEIVERSKKFTTFKQNILRDTFCEREMIKTRSVKSKFGSSYFIRSSSSRIDSKYISEPKSSETEENITKENKNLGLEADNASGEKLPPNTFEEKDKIFVPAKSVDKNKVDTKEVPVSEQSSTFIPTSQEIPKHLTGFGTPSLLKKSEIGSSEFTFAGQPDPASNASATTETTLSESKTAPFVFKAAPVFSFGASGSQSQKSVVTSAKGSEHAVVASASNTNAPVFAFKAADLSCTSSNSTSLTLPTVKSSFIFSPKTSTSFSTPSEFPAAMQEKLILNSSDNKTLATTSTTFPVFSFSNSNSASASSTVTAPSSSSSASVFKFTTSATSVFKFTSSMGSFSFSNPSNSSKTNTENPGQTFPIKPPALSTVFSNVTTSSDASASSTESVNLTSKSNLTLKGFPDTSKEVNEEKAGAASRLSDQEPVLSTPITTSTTATITNVTASALSDISQTVSAVATSLNSISEEKTESVTQECEAKENMEGNSVTPPNAAVVPKSTIANSPGKTEGSSVVSPGFSQQSATQVFTGSPAAGETVCSTSSSTPSTTISFVVPGKSIFSQSISLTTSSSIFSTTGSSIFSSAKPVSTSAPLFSATPAAAVPSPSIFGQSVTVTSTAGVSPFIQTPSTTSNASSFAQPAEDEVGKTTALFGDMLGTGLSTGSVFETPPTSAPGNIFGKSSFDKGGSNIFGNAGTAATPATTAAGLFENTSSNIFIKSSFGQSPSSLPNVFGQPQRDSNTFFGQNICSPFGSTTTTAPNQNPFASRTGFNSRPGFSQSLFGQSSTGQNPLERSSTTNIFGNTFSASPSGGNIFQMGSSSFSTSSPNSSLFSSAQSTSPATSAFQKPMAGGFGGDPVFGSGLATTATFGARPTFGGASTFGSQATFGSSQKIFGSPQGTFGQNQPNFESLASESTDGFADLAQRSQDQAYGGNTFKQNATFGADMTAFGGKSFSSWRS